MELVDCILCGADDAVEIARLRRDRYLRALEIGPQVSIKVMCARCGHLYANPQLDNEEISRLYGRIYRSPALGYADEQPSPTYLYWKQRKAEADLTWLNKQLAASQDRGTVLEIGCAEGLLLSLLAREGWHCVGVEPTLSYAQYAQETFRLLVHARVFEDVAFGKERFDLIIALKVVEHAKDPVRMLTDIRNLLKPDGAVYLTVPNALRPDNTPGEFLGAPHLSLFTASSLRRMLSRAGLGGTVVDDSRRFLRAFAGPIDLARLKIDSPVDLEQEFRRVRRAMRSYRALSAVERASIGSRQICKRVFYRLVGQRRGDRIWGHLRDIAGRSTPPESDQH